MGRLPGSATKGDDRVRARADAGRAEAGHDAGPRIRMAELGRDAAQQAARARTRARTDARKTCFRSRYL